MTKENKKDAVIGNNTLADLNADEHVTDLEIATEKLKYLMNTAFNLSADINEHDPVQCIAVAGDLKHLINIANDYVNQQIDSLMKLQAVIRTHTLADRK